MTEVLYERFYQYYNGYIVSTITFAVLLIVVLLFRKRILTVFSQANTENIRVYLLVGIILILLGGTVYFGLNLSKFSKDLNMVKQEEYVLIEAEMIRYTVVREGNQPNDPSEYMPLLRNIDNDELITLNIIYNLIDQEIYTIYYLPNCKLGVVEYID
jgi:hypothetical protein